MSIITKVLMRSSAIALTVMIIKFPTSTNAQNDALESVELDRVQLREETSWNFPSEAETISIKDNLNILEEYSISESSGSDVKLVKKNYPWSNRENIEEYFLEVEIYDY